MQVSDSPAVQSCSFTCCVELQQLAGSTFASRPSKALLQALIKLLASCLLMAPGPRGAPPTALSPARCMLVELPEMPLATTWR